MPILRMFLAHSAPFGGTGFGLGEAQVAAYISLAWFSRTLFVQWTGLADGGIEVRHKCFLVCTGLDGCGLFLRAGDFGGLALRVELDVERG